MAQNGRKILIVDDEQAIRRYLRVSLNAYGYQTMEATNGKEALTMVVSGQPDLMILDLGLPDMDGIEVTRRLHEWSKIPIIILSVRDQERDKVSALDAGADDYLTKPFATGELMARVRVAIRRSVHSASEPIFKVDDLGVDLIERRVMVGSQEIPLTPIEYELLRVLVQNAGKVLTHNQILSQVCGNNYEEEAHLLRVNMSNLRRKIEPNPSRPHYIVTEPGVGYRLRTEQAH